MSKNLDLGSAFSSTIYITYNLDITVFEIYI